MSHAQSRRGEVSPAGANTEHQGRCDRRVVPHLELWECSEAAVDVQPNHVLLVLPKNKEEVK